MHLHLLLGWNVSAFHIIEYNPAMGVWAFAIFSMTWLPNLSHLGSFVTWLKRTNSSCKANSARMIVLEGIGCFLRKSSKYRVNPSVL